MRSKFGVSERRAWRVLKQHRTTQRRLPTGRSDEAQLVEDMIALTRKFGRMILCIIERTMERRFVL